MVVCLEYRPREGVVLATAAGMTLRLATLRNPDVTAWQAAARAAATGSRIEPWIKTQEIRPGPTAARGFGDSFAGDAETAAVEIYDYPGSYAQRFDGEDRVRSSKHRQHTRVVAVTRAPAQRIAIHAGPSCGHPGCIVIAQPWDALFDRLRSARRVRIVVV